MANAKEIRSKIQSIESTKTITKAMEMVASRKMLKTQNRLKRALPYAKKMLGVISHVAKGHAEYKHPYMQIRPLKCIGYIVVSTDRGLCGGLNAHLLKMTLNTMKQNKDQGHEISLCLIGNKAMAFFKRFGANIIGHASGLSDTPSVADVIGIVKVMLDAYLNQTIDALYLASSQLISTMHQEPTLQQLLPLPTSVDTEAYHYWDYLYEPDDAPALLNHLLTRYIESQVYRAVIENIACEQAARMLGMRAATDNASELIDQLTISCNKARQSAITRELSEIVSGASTLN